MGKSLLATILNEIIDGINEANHLPKYILILLDKDLIEFIQFGGFGYKIIFEKTIDWLSREIENAIATRKEDLKLVRAGAFEPGEPQIIWVKMLVRPFIKATNRGYIFAQCHTFNGIMQNTILHFLHTHILDTEMPCDRDFFDLAGNLSSIGKQQFWKEVNYWMRQFDREKTELRPDTAHQQQPKKQKSLLSLKKNSFEKNSLENTFHFIDI